MPVRCATELRPAARSFGTPPYAAARGTSGEVAASAAPLTAPATATIANSEPIDSAPAAYRAGIAPTSTAAAAFPVTHDRRSPKRSTTGPEIAWATT